MDKIANISAEMYARMIKQTEKIVNYDINQLKPQHDKVVNKYEDLSNEALEEDRIKVKSKRLDIRG